MQLGTLPAAVPMEEVNAALSELEVSFDLVSEDKTSRYVSPLFRREDREAIAAAPRPLGFSAILPEGTGTPNGFITPRSAARGADSTGAKKIEEFASLRGAPRRAAARRGHALDAHCARRDGRKAPAVGQHLLF